MSTKIFFIGATGFIGGTVLTQILEHPKRDTFNVTVLLRSPAKVKGFESFGLRCIVGSLSDHEILERVSAESDFVFQAADSDDVPATRAILRGLKKRFHTTKTTPVFIQVSGTGILTDNAMGMYGTTSVTSDLDVLKIEALPITQPHREVDVNIIEADKQGYVQGYIVMPSTVWGIVSNAFTDMGLQNPVSRQIPDMIAVSMKRGQTMLLGEGKNIWCHVENEEMGEFFYILFNAILSNRTPPSHGREGYYFLENGEYNQKQIVKAVGAALYEFEEIDSETPVPLSKKEIEKFPQVIFLGTNARARGYRSRAMGWRPLKDTEDLLESIEPEVEHWLDEADKHKGYGGYVS